MEVQEKEMARSKVFLRRDKHYVFLPDFVVESLRIKAGGYVTMYQVDDKIYFQRD